MLKGKSGTPKKVQSLPKRKTSVMFEFIKGYRRTLSISEACRWLNFSRADYYLLCQWELCLRYFRRMPRV